MNKIAMQSPLGRPLDFRYRSNLAVVVLAALAAIVATIYNSVATDPLASPGWAVGAAVFLAWAIGRELDPDHNSSAMVGAVVGGLAATFGRPSLFLAFGVLTGVRLIAGTVGIAMGRSDAIAAVAIGAILGLSWDSVVAVPVLVAGVVVSGGLRRPLLTSVAILASAGVALLIAQPQYEWVGVSTGSLVLLAAGLTAVVTGLDPKPPQSRTDIGQSEISRQRVILARIAVGVAVALVFAVRGGDGVLAAGTIVAAVVGVAFVGLIDDRRPSVFHLPARSQS